MSGALNDPATETWCIVTDVTDDAGIVKSVHQGEHAYDEAIRELEHPDELWLRFGAPSVGERIMRWDRGLP